MPKALERELRKIARKKFPGDKKRQDRYVYGTLRKMGWKPKRKKITAIIFKPTRNISHFPTKK